MKAKILVFLLAFLLLAALGFPAEDVKTLNLPAQGIRELRIDCGAGSLSVVGSESLSAIEVTAKILTRGVDDDEKAAFYEDHVRLTLEKKGDTAVLVSLIEERGFFSWTDDARIDLTVRMPRNMDLDIDDGSGSMDIENIEGRVAIEDGSGDISVNGIIGALGVDDGSGGIEIIDVSGDVSVEDGSGSMEIRKIGGSVSVDDGSGSITVEDVEKDVVFGHTGSGGVSVHNARGRVKR